MGGRDEDAERAATEAVEVELVHEDMAFVVRAWPSAAAGGWFWTVRGAEGEYLRTGKRAWASCRAALDMGAAHVRRTF